VSRNLRASDVIQIMRLHMDAVKAFEADRESRAEDDWTEEDDAEFADIIKEIDAEAEEEAEEDSGGRPESDDSEEGSEEPE